VTEWVTFPEDNSKLTKADQFVGLVRIDKTAVPPDRIDFVDKLREKFRCR